MTTHEQQLLDAGKLAQQFLTDIEKGGDRNQLTDQFVSQIKEYPKDIIRQSIKQYVKLDNIIKYQIDENESFTKLAMSMNEYVEQLNETSNKDNA
jgi:hypothetical protein